MAAGYLTDCTAVRSRADCMNGRSSVGRAAVGDRLEDILGVAQKFVGLEGGILEPETPSFDKKVLDAQALDILVTEVVVVDGMWLEESVSLGME